MCDTEECRGSAWTTLAAMVAGLIVMAILPFAMAQEQKPTRYSVTLYSGGKAVEHWWVDRQPEVSTQSNAVFFDGRIIVGGPIVIEPANPRGPR